MKKFILGSVLALSSVATAQAATQTYTFDMIDDQYTSSSGRYNPDVGYTEISFSDSQGGKEITATFTAWADTSENQSGVTNDDEITQGELYKWGRSGWGVVNNDESSSDRPGHAFDNDGWSTDYDFVLVEFSESVALSAIDLGWTNGDSAEVTVVSLGESAPSLAGGVWTDFINAGNSNVYDISSSDGYYSLNNATTSTYWLVGAYQSVFGGHCPDDTAFKLTGLQATASTSPSQRPSQPVSEPASLAIFGLGIAGLMLRRRRNA
ncbi:exosortase-dependent surface protein XDP1 [Catenovulum sp. SX2]|uniref:exosortase-dependent surface protein XDP1 n=1 Tax=Catenovulum sp. SX2 TaxID=3398614 RepID=UPI003F868274